MEALRHTSTSVASFFILVSILAACKLSCQDEITVAESPVRVVPEKQGWVKNVGGEAAIEQLAPDAFVDSYQTIQQANLVDHKPCAPMLDLPALFNTNLPSINQSSPVDENAPIVTKDNAAPLMPFSRLSFAIDDIDMPIPPASGTIHSAVSILSSFGSHLMSSDPIGDEDGEPDEPINLVKFRENRLDVRGLNMSMLNAHLFAHSDPKFAMGITIKNTTLTGRFSYNGPAVLSEGKLAGYYRMTIENIYVVSSSNLTKRLLSGEESDPNKQYVLVSDGFSMNISNIGYITIEIFDSRDYSRPTSNYLLRMMQRVLQRTIKKTYYTFEEFIQRTLEREGRQALDCELTRFTPILDNTGASNHQGDLARIINNEIGRSHLDKVPLPNFEHTQSILGSSATIHLYNGTLSGLDHLLFNGDTRIKLQDQHLFVNASVGWRELKPYYNWDLYLGANSKAPTTKGFVSFNIKLVDFDAVLAKGLRPRTKIVVEQLIIRQLDSPKMDMSGLPGMNRVTRGVVNFFMGRLKQRLSSSIQPALKSQLERSLNKMNLFS